MIERWITGLARTRMNHDDLLPRVHGAPSVASGVVTSLCGKVVAHRYGMRPFNPEDSRACPKCAKAARQAPA